MKKKVICTFVAFLMFVIMQAYIFESKTGITSAMVNMEDTKAQDTGITQGTMIKQQSNNVLDTDKITYTFNNHQVDTPSISVIEVDNNQKREEVEYLLDADTEDGAYRGNKVSITGKNRDRLERLVQGESGGEGYIGACLVAQAIRDTMLLEDEYDVLTIKDEYEYCGKLDTEPNKSVKDAVKYVFDEGGIVVKHRVIFFYAPTKVKSKFHESQLFVVEYKGHRFFDLIEE